MNHVTRIMYQIKSINPLRYLILYEVFSSEGVGDIRKQTNGSS
jgi:hypothetical protein